MIDGAIRIMQGRWRAVPPTAVRWGALLLVLWALAAPGVRLAVGYSDVFFPLTLLAALAAMLWLIRGRDDRWVGAFYVIAIYFFTQMRDAADQTALGASTGYVLEWERWMFAGDTPSAWLQREVGGADGDPGVLAYLASFFHWSWFLFPHLVVLGTFLFARRYFFRVAMIVVGTFYTAVALYYLVPTVPPWLAADEGHLGNVTRVMDSVGPTLFGERLWHDLFQLFAEPNQKAAMPSLHFAASFIVVILGFLMRSRWLAVSALVYSLGLGFSLMYLGEHYFADLIVGGLSALAAAFLVETALGNGPGGRRWALRHQWGRLWPRWYGRLPEMQRGFGER